MTTAYIHSHTYSSDDFTEVLGIEECDFEDLYSELEFLFE